MVQGKGSLVSKMPGEYDRKFACLRMLLSFQMACPGKKLLFMGGEFAQFIEWDAGQGLDWMLLGFDRHRQMQAFVRDLNHLYRREPALWRDDAGAMEWICRDEGALALRRTGRRGEELIFLMNLSDQPLQDLRLGLPDWAGADASCPRMIQNMAAAAARISSCSGKKRAGGGV